eukprot:768067-Hanusia_phi.AAC.4
MMSLSGFCCTWRLRDQLYWMNDNNWMDSYDSKWPTTTITNDPEADGNEGDEWNYGSNFGGGSSYSTDHSIFGNYGVTDSAYSNISLCPGYAGAECSG